VGQGRADALAEFYLGRDAAKPIFTGGEEPAAILAITLHTLNGLKSASGCDTKGASE
jgi:hypothetical protein